MIDESEGSVTGAGGQTAAAIGIAMSEAAHSTSAAEEAREYLRKQSRLADLQIDNLQKVDAYETSHLRWRRFNDQMKGAMQIMLVLIGALVVFAVGAAVWNARQADGLVVDSFAVPASYAGAGITGAVVADDMTQKIAAIHDFTNGYSLAHSKEVRESGEDVKVEIPETGVSISEAWRYLRLWLGNERHLNGNLRNLPDGRIALTASLGGSDTFAFAGKPAELDALEQKAAERIFAAVDPVNIVLYLDAKGRAAETLEAAARDLSLFTDKRDLAEAYSLDADMIHSNIGDVRRALTLTNIGLALDPRSTPPHMESLNASRDLGHEEDVLAQARVIAGLRQEDNVASWRTGPGYAYVQELGAINRASETGDFANLSILPCAVYCSATSQTLLHAEAFAHMHDATRTAALIAGALSLGQPDAHELMATRYADASRARYFIHATTGDWRAAVADASHLVDHFLANRDYPRRLERLRGEVLATPLLAHALAASGDIAAARKTITETPSDCYACVRERANIDAFAGNMGGASYWFARAVRFAPSIPFAYTDWGKMLLRKGDYDGVIAEFAQAHEKGPHFADALEMWGEALMQKNRSDLALAKFEEADQYAPNWGRLHLKWGEALYYSGRREEARKQFEIASHLDLSKADADVVARMRAMHG